MIGVPAIPADVDCVAVYHRLREGVPKSSSQIGYGYNLYPAARAVTDHLSTILRTCVQTGRIAEYGTRADAADRDLAATLAGAYLGVPVSGDQVVFTHGSTEAISIVTGFLAACDTSLVLPMPCYYAFEQTTRRRGGVIAGRYRYDGTAATTGIDTRYRAMVEILPNGVTGTLFTRPEMDTDFTVLDVVFQAGGSAQATARVVQEARALVAGGLEATAVMMTPAKDMCVPGLRAGILISGHPPLIAAAREEQFDRTASINPMIGQTVLLYLTVLLLADAERTGGMRAFEQTYSWIRSQFTDHDVAPIPTLETCVEIIDHLRGMAAHFTRAFALLNDHPSPLLETGDGLRPMAGYSLLPRVHAPLGDTEKVIAWVNAIGRHHHLKLNPMLLFGGSAPAWETLYPGQARLRVNLSVPHLDLTTSLKLLDYAHAEITKRGTP
ncbi:aminotransferase class I/II-fold pyridoxal phosphate-dependent enzyme [Nonomuraea sp. FMUSA5-5]|uniref:Aminotransferase class I/II-fold pyridoxal phosphate-dependent enzyme n=1 Tax=Nonomuraea composti TaxID=2720023 RepID=A0ABX1BJZ4_9ACTN|nr:aminotransferase class I/II-fold pyridoxal phosphate-dependent enzyme [Nonomuraea sp. FMUSA5-5]NJP95433.1 aminotransferase class I/II-fold pyridoxal phosphate-dependent enzyme [Nonomuraea sp. FMUSA5-5]